ncbi:MAG TPA: acyl carrier protein [Vicinamibacterales bacterium]
MTSIEARMLLVPEIREFIVANFLFGLADQTLEDDDSFLASGIIDSTGVLELIGFLEKQYGITVENAELLPDHLDSVNKVASFVRRKLGN